MKKKTKNITTYILGLIMMLISIYMFYTDKDFIHCLTVFILGLGVFSSYTKLSDILNKKIPR
jgi:uncharacterized membrane protein YqgA involved in biofilm formation